MRKLPTKKIISDFFDTLSIRRFLGKRNVITKLKLKSTKYRYFDLVIEYIESYKGREKKNINSIPI